LDYCTSYGEVSAFKKEATNARVKFATGDAVAFVKQNPMCFISGKNCKPIVYNFERLFMTEAEKVISSSLVILDYTEWEKLST
jgi:hypothetical protein